MKRWVMAALLLIAAAGIVVAWQVFPLFASQPAGSSAAELGMLLLDTDEGISVLAVQSKSVAEQLGICPGDRLLEMNGTPLSTAEALDGLLMNEGEKNVSLRLQRGTDIFSVFLPSNVY